MKEDPHFCRYYEGIYILFKTGLRISEFCGLTISDIDFKEHTINIDHQLQKKSKIGYYIQETKTTSGTRKIPMTADVEECFRKIIEKRNPPKAEPMVDGKSGFLYFDKNESICYSLHWEHYFQHIIQKYNNTYKVQIGNMINKVVQGWINYYTHYYKSEFYEVLRYINQCLIKWVRRSYKKKNTRSRAEHWLGAVARRDRNLFAHWKFGILPSVGEGAV